MNSTPATSKARKIREGPATGIRLLASKSERRRHVPISHRESADECRNGTICGMSSSEMSRDCDITYHLEPSGEFNFLFNPNGLVKLVIRSGN
jgi:hypothetical protein